MNDVPSSHEPWDDVDALYRRASALDPSRPSASVDTEILAHAARVAAGRGPDAAISGRRMRRRLRFGRRPALFGMLAAAALAGLLALPLWLMPSMRGAPTYTEEFSAETAAPAPIAKQLEAAEPPPAPVAKKMAPRAPLPTAALAAPPSTPPTSAAARRPRAISSSPATRIASAPAAAASGALSERKLAAPAEARDTTRDKARDEAANAPIPSGYDSITVTAQRRTQNDLAMTSPAATVQLEGAEQSPAELAEVVSTAPHTRLFEAAKAGNLKELQTALDAPADINSRDENGATALLIATRNGQAKAVKMLLAHGADPNIAATDGTTPLTAATKGGQPAIARALKRAGAH